jgi:hypothetical protein
MPGDLLPSPGPQRTATFGEPISGVTIARSPALAWWLVADWR